MALKKELSKEEKEVFKVIKTLRQGYTIENFLKAIKKVKRQEQKKAKIPQK